VTPPTDPARAAAEPLCPDCRSPLRLVGSLGLAVGDGWECRACWSRWLRKGRIWIKGWPRPNPADLDVDDEVVPR
jgi:hypothetical protein